MFLEPKEQNFRDGPYVEVCMFLFHCGCLLKQMSTILRGFCGGIPPQLYQHFCYHEGYLCVAVRISIGERRAQAQMLVLKRIKIGGDLKMTALNSYIINSI